MFTLLGLLLTGQGWLNNNNAYQCSLNINLWWGLVLLVFGLLMLIPAWFAKKKQ
ncbi:MAG: hypothetical protein LBD30_07175 [Verrucomicrobiales bacterium]|jgi:hypothetical protein|nr:hypothetical protein [Verrucomicrobiales bacterium]